MQGLCACVARVRRKHSVGPRCLTLTGREFLQELGAWLRRHASAVADEVAVSAAVLDELEGSLVPDTHPQYWPTLQARGFAVGMGGVVWA